MTTQTSRTCVLPEGLRYYLLRQNDVRGSVIVPLVPADQLPFLLHGVPRELTHRQMSDQGWKFLSETNEAPMLLSVQAPQPTATPRYLAPDHHVRAVPQPAIAGKTRIDPLPHPTPGPESVREDRQDSGLGLSEHPSSLIDKLASIYPKDAQRLGYRASNSSGAEPDPFKKEFTKPWPSGIEPDSSKKEYCTHWIRTGECSFTAVGCKFKHEMPGIEKLHELGFRSIPQWWKEKSAIGARAPTWMQRRLAGNDDADRAAEARDFPDPSTLFRKMTPKERVSIMRNEEPKHQESHSFLKRIDSVMSPETPSAPVSAARRDSQMSNLLIDLDETPAPLPSPQLSQATMTSNDSSDDESLPARPIPSSDLNPKHSPRIGRRPADKNEQKQKLKPCPPAFAPHRRRSSLSIYDSSRKTTITTIAAEPTTKAPAPTQQPRAPITTIRRTDPAPTKLSGLSASKYNCIPALDHSCTAREQPPRPKVHRGKYNKLKGGKHGKLSAAV
ncbi:hypothetical protein PtrSN002B_008107 [Pyrenophora tritici-repentis]|uniref:FAP domain containing protein n=2 Tax=Pyrenophora tritici-repentis TaxID=45151 RepID=A0A2W1EZ34_9PLEO|nr:uncharacterized protein PTRG_01599 [Pyrenophora tritici-repentis Pt-1C-BFP]KAA8626265.1 hypothetical protein PtrV1_01945 [Pyrenophora tritici-repentis]EDU41037.1 conserved hypothetical protein [Pyrenophora tritici-repentis Pt-1C-BFP]KAF7454676.1 hypothetical protein A1F99_019340 [Pyrenophora tritici-repentis]KAF7577804.1 FAP domain containing protein [Pyrenophora tritici-repentis]KAG9388433.1 hypothetical protein A1F94_001325 [Pyrenophora tritici-repentis]